MSDRPVCVRFLFYYSWLVIVTWKQIADSPVFTMSGLAFLLYKLWQAVSFFQHMAGHLVLTISCRPTICIFTDMPFRFYTSPILQSVKENIRWAFSRAYFQISGRPLPNGLSNQVGNWAGHFCTYLGMRQAKFWRNPKYLRRAFLCSQGMIMIDEEGQVCDE